MTPTSPSFALDLSPAPDLHPLYPTPSQITNALTIRSTLSAAQKSQLVAHCASRACVFGDLTLLQHILYDPHAQTFLDLNTRDEDGLGLVSLAIHGFGTDGDRDVEREECVRLLVNQGALMLPDHGLSRLSFPLFHRSVSINDSRLDTTPLRCFTLTADPCFIFDDPRLLCLRFDKP
jgi:hypothetical protein